MRFNPYGVLDSSFGTNGIVVLDVQSKYDQYGRGPAPAVALQRDGKIVVAGNGKNKFSVVRYNGDPVHENHSNHNILSKQISTNTSSPYISPNPVKNVLQIQHLSSSTKTISIIDLKGEVLQQAFTANGNFSFNVNQLSAGIYFVKINDQNKTATLKFIKE